MVPLFREEDVRRLLTIDEVIEAVDRAFHEVGHQRASNLPRQRLRTTTAMLHVMAAASEAVQLLAYKAYATTRQGASFYAGVHDGRSGQLLAWIEADWLGRLRTGAASAVATRYMAPPGAEVLAVLGAGRQAETQVLAISRVLNLKHVRLYSRTPQRRDSLAQHLKQAYALPVVAASSPQEAVRDAHVVVTVTTSRSPVLRGEWLRPGVHINAVGSNAFDRAELDVEVFRRADHVVADSLEQARIEAGDFREALELGVLTWERIYALSDVVIGRVVGRPRPDSITVFESLGIALEDLAAATVLLRKAGLLPGER
jgi:alanine dehydrogenase